MLKLSVKEGDGLKISLPDGEIITIRCFTSNKAPNKIDYLIDADKSIHIDKMYYNGKTYREIKEAEEQRKKNVSPSYNKAQG